MLHYSTAAHLIFFPLQNTSRLGRALSGLWRAGSPPVGLSMALDPGHAARGGSALHFQLEILMTAKGQKLLHRVSESRGFPSST